MIEIFKYAVAGVINTCVGYAVFFVLLRWIGFGPAISNTIGYAVALLVAFLLNKYFVFSKSKARGSAVGRFAVSFCVAFLLNQFVLLILLGWFNLRAEIAQIFAMAAYSVIFYLLSKCFVFAAERKQAFLNNNA